MNYINSLTIGGEEYQIMPKISKPLIINEYDALGLKFDWNYFTLDSYGSLRTVPRIEHTDSPLGIRGSYLYLAFDRSSFYTQSGVLYAYGSSPNVSYPLEFSGDKIYLRYGYGLGGFGDKLGIRCGAGLFITSDGCLAATGGVGVDTYTIIQQSSGNLAVNYDNNTLNKVNYRGDKYLSVRLLPMGYYDQISIDGFAGLGICHSGIGVYATDGLGFSDNGALKISCYKNEETSIIDNTYQYSSSMSVFNKQLSIDLKTLASELAQVLKVSSDGITLESTLK